MHHRWLARGLVVALHAAALLALWQHRLPGRVEPGERRFTTVRLIEPRRPAPPPREQPRPLALPRVSAPVLPPAAVTLDAQPLDDAAPAATAPAPPPTPQTAAAEPPRMTLKLTLPPGYAASANARRNPALDDPRSNTPRLTLEDRIAAATGGAGAWVEEPVENHSQAIGALGDHRTVMRKGNTCVEVFRSRIADSDPFNGSVAPRTVPMMGKPYKCKGPGR